MAQLLPACKILALRDALPALNCQLHVHRARMGAHFSAGRVLENLGSRDRIDQYYSVSRDGHQVHPRRMTRIDSVKINPSLVMVREWFLQKLLTQTARRQSLPSSRGGLKYNYPIHVVFIISRAV